MFLKKDVYNELIRQRDFYKDLCERICKLNGVILDSNKQLLDDLAELRANERNPLAHPESYVDDVIAMVGDMTVAQRAAVAPYVAKALGMREVNDD